METEMPAIKNFSIRPAAAADCAAIEVIAETAYSIYLSRMDRKPAPMTEEYAGKIADGQVHVLSAGDGGGGSIRGFLVLVPGPDHMLLENIAVDPDCQGKGYGKALIHFAEQAALDAGHGRLLLYTNAVMLENILLYSRLGFAETHRSRSCGFDRVFMAKELLRP